MAAYHKPTLLNLSEDPSRLHCVAGATQIISTCNYGTSASFTGGSCTPTGGQASCVGGNATANSQNCVSVGTNTSYHAHSCGGGGNTLPGTCVSGTDASSCSAGTGVK